MTRIAVEHLESEYSLWIIFEYIHLSKICDGRVVYTNISKPRVAKILSRYGEVTDQSILDFEEHDNLIILDPEARETLKPEEASKARYLVIGGILGDHPPKKRTEKLLSSRAPKALKRNLGEKQMSIDSAAYTAYQILLGKRLDEIDFIDGLKIVSEDWEVELPYRYPLVDGEPLISPTIHRIISKIGIFDEYWLRTL